VSGHAALLPQQAAVRARSAVADVVVLTPPDSLDQAAMQRAVEALVRHHDILRGDFTADQRLMIGQGIPDGLWQVGPAAVAPATEDILIGAPRFRAIWVAETEMTHLVLLAHPALLDAESWRIVAEDVIRFADAPDVLPEKTTSALQLADREPYGAAETTGPAPVQHERYALTLSKFAANGLRGAALRPYRLTQQDLLATALLRASDGSEQFALDIAQSGRDGLGAEIDLSRTAGRFEIITPHLFDIHRDMTPRAAVISVKEQIRLGKGDGPTEQGAVLVRADTPRRPVGDGWKCSPLPNRPTSGHEFIIGID